MAYNPWMPGQPDPRLQPPPYGPVNEGESGPWDGVQSVGPSVQQLLDQQMHLRAQAPHSGLKENASLTEDENQRRTAESHAGTWLSPEEVLANSAASAEIPQIKAAQQSQEQNRRLMQLELARPRTADLANPLSIAAHNINPAYAIIPPSSQATMNEKEVREWAKQQQDDQRDLARTIISANNSAKSGFYQDQILQSLGIKKAMGETAQDPYLHPNNAPASNFLKWAQATDHTMQKDQEALGEAEQLRLAIHGSPAAQRSVPLMLAKMLTGASRVPVQEAMMEKGDPAFANTIEQKWNTLANGEITPSNKKEYSDFIDQLMALHARGIKNHTDQGIARGTPMGLDQGAMKNYMQSQFTTPHAPPPSTAPAKPKVDIDALILQELKKGGQ